MPKTQKKPKLTDSPSSLVLDAPPGPPPPYVDDGSHDILQEVLAIEREKEQRQRAQLEKERSTAVAITGKRKKDDVIDEEEILRLATPAKKERPSPPGPSAVRPKAHLQANSRPSALPNKVKKEKTAQLSRASTSRSPVPSVKGKEKEVMLDNESTQGKPRKQVHGTPINEKKCKDLLKTLLKVPESVIFKEPVDPVRDGCPTWVQFGLCN